MKEKKYKQRTKVLGIPVPGYKDSIWPEVELKKWQLVENMLLGALQGVKTLLFRHGGITLRKEDDDTYTAIMTASGNSGAAAEGIINGSYFRSKSLLEWKGLREGGHYYLYIAGDSRTVMEHHRVRATVSGHQRSQDTLLMVAKVETLGRRPKVIPSPAGRISVSKLLEHMNDSDCPHGKLLIQKELAAGKLAVSESIEFGDSGPIGVDKLKEMIANLATSSPTIVDFESGGPDGIAILSESNANFAHASGRKTEADNGSLGEITIGYFGQDPKVENEKQIRVYNDGSAGVPVRAIIF